MVETHRLQKLSCGKDQPFGERGLTCIFGYYMKLKTYEVAQALGLPIATVDRWIRQGRIPLNKSGSDCLFNEKNLKQWASRHNLRFRLPEGTGVMQLGHKPEGLCEVMKRGGIHYNVSGEDVFSAIKSVSRLVPGLDENQKEELFEKLYAREQLTSTGVGKGVAIPHPRTPLENGPEHPVILTCFLEHGIDYNAVDDMTVFVLFVLLSPTVKLHLHYLSRLSFCLRNDNFIAFLKAAPEPEAFFARIAAFDSMDP